MPGTARGSAAVTKRHSSSLFPIRAKGQMSWELSDSYMGISGGKELTCRYETHGGLAIRRSRPVAPDCDSYVSQATDIPLAMRVMNCTLQEYTWVTSATAHSSAALRAGTRNSAANRATVHAARRAGENEPAARCGPTSAGHAVTSSPRSGGAWRLPGSASFLSASGRRRRLSCSAAQALWCRSGPCAPSAPAR
jgi:hypothetical protein